MITKNKKLNVKSSDSDNDIGNELMQAFKSLESDGDNRKLGLYGELDVEKGEMCVYTLLHLHDTRMKKVPRPLTTAQKKKIKKATQENDNSAQIELKFDDVSQPIEFIISTPGGRACDMFSIYDTMRMIRKDCDIHTFGLGQVMSAGTLLLASGTKGKRKIGRHCRVMLHQVSAGTSGPHHEMMNEIAEIEYTQQQYIKCLAAETKMSETYIRKLFERKVNIYMSAEEAVKHGLADIIV